MLGAFPKLLIGSYGLIATTLEFLAVSDTRILQNFLNKVSPKLFYENLQF